MVSIRLFLFGGLLPLLTIGGSFKYSGFFQWRLDYGDLQKTSHGYSSKTDLYLRRFELKTVLKPRRGIKIVSKLALDNWFRNYKGGKGYNFPKKVLIKKLFLQLEPSKYLTLRVGRDKKPYSGEGLSSSSKLLLVDKSYLFRKVKKSFGDYYGNQLEVELKIPQRGLKFSIATAYGWGFKDFNPYRKKYRLTSKRYWLNNAFLRVEYIPPTLKGDTKALNTFGGKTFRIGLSYAYAGNLELKTQGGNYGGIARLEEGDILFRTPKWKVGTFSLYGEVDRLAYRFGGNVENYLLEGFELQGGYRPPWVFKGIKSETALGFERITTHPGSKNEYIYGGNVNFYFPKGVKLTLALTDRVSGGEAQKVFSFQLQWVF